jgi:spoIIIJ-associated protein
MEEDYREFEAKTVDEAIVTAMRTFRLDFENLDIRVISEGSKGLFGLVGTKSAKILARPAQKQDTKAGFPARKTAQEPAPEMEPASAPEKRPAPVQQAVPREEMENACRIVTEILDLMNISAKVSERGENTIEVVGDGSGLLIGKRGQTLDALQFIVNRMLNKNREEPVYVTVDTEGYRQRHMDLLRSMALKMGQKAKRTGQSVFLEKMNPYDRRIIHLALKNDVQVNTKSVGDGVYKKVLIVPKRASRS